MKVEIEASSGFCFGVKRAISLAEDILKNDNSLSCLGDIVHNGAEIDRLSELGLSTIDTVDQEESGSKKVLLRAHGEPPSTYKKATEQNIELVDDTCPIVLKLQQKIKKAYLENPNENQIVIFGKATHPEVISLCGQTDNQAIVVRSFADIEKLDFSKTTYLFSQTTMDTAEYKKMAEEIKAKLNTGIEFHVKNSICGAVSGRESKLREFAKKHPLIVFVGGKKSSNAKMLFEICKSENPNSYFISRTKELDLNWFQDGESVGVCGATSTPQWLLEKVAEWIGKK